jgi:pSer/pThr/pTyr-binding forkhead associated (FHA) protein
VRASYDRLSPSGDPEDVVRLFDNTNGATRNGAELTAGVEQPLAAGDRIAIGAFTVIRVVALRT